MSQTATVALVEERDAHAYGFSIRSGANGFLYRILPMRDPEQPRFWCVVIYRCGPGGMADMTERPWLGRRGLRREDLKDVLGAMRADPSQWLAEDSQSDLLDWLTAPGANPAQELEPTVSDQDAAPDDSAPRPTRVELSTAAWEHR